MRIRRLKYASLIFTVMMITSTMAVLRAYGAFPPWQGYVKPAFPDYAASGMPDFDEKQPQFTTDGGHVQYSWCVPVAVADSLWWLDSKYESKNYSYPVPPPTISDHFNLVTAYGGLWDDHDPQNVFGLVAELATYMHTDGIGIGGGYIGTKYADIQPGINTYLTNHGVAGLFEVHGLDFANFNWIDQQVEMSQDVELCLEFWYFNGHGWQPVTTPIFELGHCVTCAGINSTTNQVLVSDPYYNAFEAGLVPGRSPVPHLDISTADHNNATLVSQDAYNLMQFPFPPGLTPPGYPGIVWELQNYLQINGFTIDPNWHAFIRGAVATSPLGIDDVAITNLTSTPANATIHQGLLVNLTATVQNQGNFTETFNVTVCANTTSLASQNVTLLSGNTTNMTFTWNTTGFAGGNYTLKASADTVPEETNTANNNFTDGWVRVAILEDITGGTPNLLDFVPDGKVDMKDVGVVARFWGMNVPPAPPNCDITGPTAGVPDGKVDMRDVGLVARHFGEHE